jgi:hypothetical protein
LDGQVALGLLHWKTRVHHKKVFLDEWAPVKKPTSLGGREGENLRRRGTEKAQGAFGFAQLAAEFGRITADQVPKPAADRKSTFVDSARPFETLSRVVDRTNSLLKNSRFGDDFVIREFVANLGGSDAGQIRGSGRPFFLYFARDAGAEGPSTSQDPGAGARCSWGPEPRTWPALFERRTSLDPPLSSC